MSSSRPYNIIFAGEFGVGKTTLFQYLRDNLLQGSVSTTAPSFMTSSRKWEKWRHRVTCRGGATPEVILWDTSEMEMNGIKGMTRSYFTNSVAAILVYDIGELDSLHKLDEWVDRLEWSDSADIVLSMWGNDKGNTNNLVSDENSRGFAGIHGVKEELMFKVNAKSGWKVVESYHRVIEEVCSRYSSHNAEPSPESYKWTRFFGYSASVDSGTYTNPASLQSSHATNPHGPGVLQVQVDDRVRLVPDHEPHPGGGEEQRSKCFIFKMC